MPTASPLNVAKPAAPQRFLRNLAQDPSGNTMALVAAATIPMLALVGGGVDMGRGYLSQSRLQQACDAGALAARQKLGSNVAAGGVLPADAAAVGKRFFDTNFVDGQFGTKDRSFQLTLESDYSVKGVAEVTVPATVMRALGFDKTTVAVNCMAKLNFSNTDVMMVLDTTASMDEALPGDTVTKITALRNVVKDFYNELEKNKPTGIRIRYGFLPYSENVNVGALLKPEWVVDKWNYEGRVAIDREGTEEIRDKEIYWNSGEPKATGPYSGGVCPTPTLRWYTIEKIADYYNDKGQHVVEQLSAGDGLEVFCTSKGDGKFEWYTKVWNDYRYKERFTTVGTRQRRQWDYRPVEVDLAFIKNGKMAGATTSMPMGGWSNEAYPIDINYLGCIEERQTYDFGTSRTPDLKQALDLDLDTVPVAGNPATQWRPMLHQISFLRSIYDTTNGEFTPAAVKTPDWFARADEATLSVCPSPARALSATSVNSYVDGLKTGGSTYHDIGMIWGGRLLSANGLFKADNADINGQPTSRHLIFLTDGETATNWHTYGAYGIEPLSLRRTAFPGGRRDATALNAVVENRFRIACDEVKKRNITVWVIGFGVKMTDMLKECAGDGRYFQADDAKELNDVFKNIASSMGDLRISK